MKQIYRISRQTMGGDTYWIGIFDDYDLAYAQFEKSFNKFRERGWKHLILRMDRAYINTADFNPLPLFEGRISARLDCFLDEYTNDDRCTWVGTKEWKIN